MHTEIDRPGVSSGRAAAADDAAIPVTRNAIGAYLHRLFGCAIRVTAMRVLGGGADQQNGKAYGYGRPLLIEFERDGTSHRAVLHTMAPGPFGHQHAADRAAILAWSHAAFNRLPRHLRSIDLGAVAADGSLVSLGEAREAFLLTEYAAGRVYADDLRRLREGGPLTEADHRRCDLLCDYLVEIHAERGGDPTLYTRRIRELVGHGECIMGLIDSYPADCAAAPPHVLREIERAAVDWRWRIKDRTHRMRRVHGDFHPWNILFRRDDSFSVLDRSRGEYGDPADDVASITMNYLFESLQATGRLAGPLGELFARFWGRYLTATGDDEMLDVAAPFIAFRGLVMASPVWFPSIDEGVRRRMIGLVRSVLAAERFDPTDAEEHLHG